MNNIDEKMKKMMEKAIDSFIEERVSTFTSPELNDKFSNGKKAIDELYKYIEEKGKQEKFTLH